MEWNETGKKGKEMYRMEWNEYNKWNGMSIMKRKEWNLPCFIVWMF